MRQSKSSIKLKSPYKNLNETDHEILEEVKESQEIVKELQ